MKNRIKKIIKYLKWLEQEKIKAAIHNCSSAGLL